MQQELHADQFISSMPIKDLVAAIEHGADGNESVQVPSELQRVAKGLPYRDFVTVGLLVKRMRLRNTTDIPTLGNQIGRAHV